MTLHKMSETNGKIVSLEAARSRGNRKGNDFITVQQAYDMVIQECAKVHEHYLTQLPNHMAVMIQDALLEYKLIEPLPPDIRPASEATAVPETPSGDDAEPDTVTPAPERFEIAKTPFANTLTGDPAAPERVGEVFPE